MPLLSALFWPKCMSSSVKKLELEIIELKSLMVLITLTKSQEKNPFLHILTPLITLRMDPVTWKKST